MRTSRPSSWALSIRDFSSSGVPQRLLGAKKFVTWYLQNIFKKKPLKLRSRDHLKKKKKRKLKHRNVRAYAEADHTQN